MYISRTLSAVLTSVSSLFPVVLITGPRQVGKTTLLEHAEKGARGYVTLDDLDERALAKKDPALFLQMHPAPVTIDEIQYAPELFSAIKMAVDKAKRAGMYWLTGSQKYHLMQGITESLAGRVAILDMLGLSQGEIAGRAFDVLPFLPDDEWLSHAKKTVVHPETILNIYQKIWLGSFPKVVLEKNMSHEIFYKSYVQTYIERDVRALTQIGDELAFNRFLRTCAARTGQLLNYADMARDVDVDQKTIKKWLSILEASSLVYLLYPYHNNVTKRAIKTPKLYFVDTGLCCFLTQWSSSKALEAGAMSGALLETYLVSELLKSYWHNGKSAHFYFYRDRDQYEIDLLIVKDNQLYPVEFKKTASPGLTAIKSFKVLEQLGQPVGIGAVLCFKETDIFLSREVRAIPIGYL